MTGQPSLVRVTALLGAAAAVLVGLDWAADTRPAAAAPAVATLGPAASYDALHAQMSATFDDRRQRAAVRSDEWLIQEQFARTAFARARLSGSYEDYASAQRALDRAFKSAPPGAGPHLSQATLHLMLHRLGPAEEMLDAVDRYAVPPDAGERAEIAGMRGDIAFYRGDYRAALAHYDDADRFELGAADFRRAVFQSKTGRPDLAARYFDAYEARLVRPDRHLRSNMALQRGILDLDNGRLEAAMAHFRRAEAIFPGWWLVEEHIAETTALLGDNAGAERLYRRVIARTGSPEFMDALAALMIERGATEEAALLARQSALAWNRRLGLFPESAYGHALGHCATIGRTECALRLARRNYAARPHGGAGEELAAALHAAGRTDEARAEIDRVLASPWRTAVTYATAFQVYQAQGDTARAAAFRAEALRTNKHVPL